MILLNPPKDWVIPFIISFRKSKRDIFISSSGRSDANVVDIKPILTYIPANLPAYKDSLTLKLEYLTTSLLIALEGKSTLGQGFAVLV